MSAMPPKAYIWNQNTEAPAVANDGAVEMIDTSVVRVHQHGAASRATKNNLRAGRALVARSVGHHPGHGSEFHQNAILLRRINVIWVVQSPLAKIFRSTRRANHF